MPAEPARESLGLRIVPPLEDGAWVQVTAELLYGWKLSAEQDRKREAGPPRTRAPNKNSNR